MLSCGEVAGQLVGVERGQRHPCEQPKFVRLQIMVSGEHERFTDQLRTHLPVLAFLVIDDRGELWVDERDTVLHVQQLGLESGVDVPPG
jgi:hypothetical protein